MHFPMAVFLQFIMPSFKLISLLNYMLLLRIYDILFSKICKKKNADTSIQVFWHCLPAIREYIFV